MAMRRQKRIERESKINLKHETSATRNGLRTVNGSAETTVALSQNETEVHVHRRVEKILFRCYVHTLAYRKSWMEVEPMPKQQQHFQEVCVYLS